MQDPADICDQKQDAYAAMSRGPEDEHIPEPCGDCDDLDYCLQLGFPEPLEDCPRANRIRHELDSTWQCPRCSQIYPMSHLYCDCPM